MAKQVLSARAKLAKKKRDLAAANTDRRKAMRAENQRRRRAALKAGTVIAGKDWDHKTHSFVTIANNRGSFGKGTKNERNA